MAVINWPQSPIAEVRKHQNVEVPTERYEYVWSFPTNFPIKMGGLGDFIKITIRCNSHTDSHNKFRFKVFLVDKESNAVTGIIYSSEEIIACANEYEDCDVNIPIESDVVRFKIVLETRHRSAWGTDVWDFPPGEKIYTAFIYYFGDFSLDYVPLTILYCPPGNEMTNSLSNSTSLATIFTVSEEKIEGIEQGSEQSVGGGLKLMTGRYNIGDAEGRNSSNSINESARNIISSYYEWKTTLIADNKNTIGCSYWGPLGDIFLILKNPWFRIITNEDTTLNIGISEKTETHTELLIIPAHKLLRPGEDPIASRIPPETRRRILELDPFIQYLNLFFPKDLGLPLTLAANPYRNPSVELWDSVTATELTEPKLAPMDLEEFTEKSLGLIESASGKKFLISEPTPRVSIGQNRAAFIARYSIDNGVIIDLNYEEELRVDDWRGNERMYASKVTDVVAVEGAFDLSFFKKGLELGGIFTMGKKEEDARFTIISYQNSCESDMKKCKSARCTLIRNQNEADLSDIEIWWDKLFSTFMFRKIKPELGAIDGTASSLDGLRVSNSPIQLISETESYTTMSNHKGEFSFRNVEPGKYIMKCGDKKRNVTISKKSIENGQINYIELNNVKKIIDLETSPLWELAESLDTNITIAQRIQTEINKKKKIDEKTFKSILEKENISLANVKKKALIHYSDNIYIAAADAQKISRTLKIDLQKAQKIESAIAKEKKLNKNKFSRILKKEKVPLRKVRKGLAIKYKIN